MSNYTTTTIITNITTSSRGEELKTTPATTVEWSFEKYFRPKPFGATMFLSASPFLATILILFFVSAVLSRLFTFVRARKRDRIAKDQMIMQNFLELVTYGQTDLIDNERTFEEIVGRGKQARVFEKKPLRERSFGAMLWRKPRKPSLTDFHLPDEDRCPMELVNDVLARQARKHQSIAGLIAKPAKVKLKTKT